MASEVFAEDTGLPDARTSAFQWFPASGVDVGSREKAENVVFFASAGDTHHPRQAKNAECRCVLGVSAPEPLPEKAELRLRLV